MKQLSILFLGLILISCYREVDLDEHRSTPKMVINSTVSPDTVIMASITRTWFYPDGNPDVSLPHAKVELYINDQYVEQMEWKILEDPRHPGQTCSLFVSDTIPTEGDKIKIIASTPEYGTATAEDIIPNKIPIKDVQYSIKKGEGIYEETYEDYYEVYYEVTFEEPANENNYYLIRVMTRWDDDYYGPAWTPAEMEFIDPIFKEQDAILDESMGFNGLNKRGGALFTDRSINGKTYTLQVKEIAITLEETEPRIISIYSLSESYYFYLLSLQKLSGSTLEGGLGNIGFAEPLRIYSNVQGGTGILGGNQHADMEITLKQHN